MLVSRAIIPSSLVREIPNLIPISVPQLWHKSLHFERHFAQPEKTRVFPLSDDLTQALFYQRTEGRALASRDFSCFT